MDTFIKILNEFLTEISKSINEKINGTAYLEILKFGLINNFKGLEKKFFDEIKAQLTNKKIIEKTIQIDNKKITYKIEFFDKFQSKEEQSFDIDFLFLVIEGLANMIIFDKKNISKSINSKLSNNMGVVLSEGTVFTNKIAEKSIILSILNV